MSSTPEVLAEEFTPGLADWFDENVAPAVSVTEAADRLEGYARDHEFPTPDARGLSVAEAYANLVLWLRGRELIVDEGIQRASFHWLTFHVPPGGKGSIGWTQSQSSSNGLTLKVFGSGLGGKATLKFSRGIELAGCGSCQEIIQWLEVRMRRYRVKSDTGDAVEEQTVDPVRWLHQVPRDRSGCCGQPLAKLSRFSFEVLDDEKIDARQTKALLKASRDLELTVGSTSSLKLELPTGIEAGLELASTGTLGCKMAWEFPPGKLYVPFARRGLRSLPPQWSIG
jgi:hypothetical protein